MSDTQHPCMRCGACCANFRVEFSVYEMQSMGGLVPDGLAHEVHGNRWRMNGTERRPVRCVALEGRCGEQVACGIYAQRSSTCRDFEMGTDRCNDARRAHGLPALDESARIWPAAA